MPRWKNAKAHNSGEHPQSCCVNGSLFIVAGRRKVSEAKLVSLGSISFSLSLKYKSKGGADSGGRLYERWI